MSYKSLKPYKNITVAQRSDGSWGVLDHNGNEIVPFGKYNWIDGFDQGLARVMAHGVSGSVANVVAIIDLESENGKIIVGQNNLEDYINKNRAKHPERYAKWGIINEKGEEVLPVKYDEIWNFLGKNRYSTKAVVGGESYEIYFHDLNPSLPVRGQRSYGGDYGTHYGEYAGSYAQDVMGYSDDVIDDAFDGDPDAYWNID